MKRRDLLTLAAASGLAACSGMPPRGSAGSRSMQFASDFDADCYRALAAEPGNQFVSPFSVACAFALLYPGAGGQTAAEIASTIGFDPSPAAVATRIRDLRAMLTDKAGGSEFSIANAAWVERTMGLRAEYARMASEELGAVIEPVDFIADQLAALRRINSWTAKETRDRIKEIIPEDDIVRDRRLVLTNAVYFKGRWSDPFSAEDTEDSEFFPASGAAQKAQLMRHVTSARYFDGGDFQAAEFDYDAGEFGLAVFLPRRRAGLSAFEREISGGRLDGWLRRLTEAESERLDVTLPKVKVEAKYELKKPLEALGIRIAFTRDADLSGITDQEQLAVASVKHKTFLAIDEEGTEAAAITAIDVVRTTSALAPRPPPIEFKADHPFFIVLRHKPSGVRLFLGRIATTS